MHVGIAYLRWWGKRSRHSRRMRTRNFAYLARGPLASVSPGVSLKCFEIWQDARPSCPMLRYCYIYQQTVKYTLELADLFMITYMLISLRVWQNISCSKSILLTALLTGIVFGIFWYTTSYPKVGFIRFENVYYLEVSYETIVSLRPIDAYTRQQSRPSLVQIMAWHIFNRTLRNKVRWN